MKTFLKYLVVILLSAALGGLIVAFLLPYADDGDEGGTTIDTPDDTDNDNTDGDNTDPENPDDGADKPQIPPADGDDDHVTEQPNEGISLNYDITLDYSSEDGAATMLKVVSGILPGFSVNLEDFDRSVSEGDIVKVLFTYKPLNADYLTYLLDCEVVLSDGLYYVLPVAPMDMSNIIGESANWAEYLVCRSSPLDIGAFAEQAGGYGSEYNTSSEIVSDGFTFAAGMCAEERNDGVCINNQQQAITFTLEGDINSISLRFAGASSNSCTMFLYSGEEVVHAWASLANNEFNTDDENGETISDLPAGTYTLISVGSARIYSLSLAEIFNS